MQQAIIELIGSPNAGKTTLAIVLGEELGTVNVLYIDATPDQRLTEILAFDPPEITLSQLVKQAQTENREAIDWAFHDLTVAVSDEADLLTVGNLPETLNPADEERLRYGLSRLVIAYDYVIIDGFHPLLHRWLPEENVHTLLVLTTADWSTWQLPNAPDASIVRTPSVILNQYGGEPFPAALDAMLLDGQATLIGKLPRYATADECIRKLPDDFKNCLLRMNIPLNFSHS